MNRTDHYQAMSRAKIIHKISCTFSLFCSEMLKQTVESSVVIWLLHCRTATVTCCSNKHSFYNEQQTEFNF